jgi:hypothetical protein
MKDEIDCCEKCGSPFYLEAAHMLLPRENVVVTREKVGICINYSGTCSVALTFYDTFSKK